MADITMCEGTDCPLKDKCYRYLAPKNPYRQSYFVNAPIKNSNCDYYWEIGETGTEQIKNT